jgi:hypothetical protein
MMADTQAQSLSHVVTSAPHELRMHEMQPVVDAPESPIAASGTSTVAMLASGTQAAASAAASIEASGVGVVSVVTSDVLESGEPPVVVSFELQPAVAVAASAPTAASATKH